MLLFYLPYTFNIFFFIFIIVYCFLFGILTYLFSIACSHFFSIFFWPFLYNVNIGAVSFCMEYHEKKMLNLIFHYWIHWETISQNVGNECDDTTKDLIKDIFLWRIINTFLSFTFRFWFCFECQSIEAFEYPSSFIVLNENSGSEEYSSKNLIYFQMRRSFCFFPTHRYLWILLTQVWWICGSHHKFFFLHLMETSLTRPQNITYYYQINPIFIYVAYVVNGIMNY